MDNLFIERFKELIVNSNEPYEVIANKLGFKSKGTISKYINGKIKNINYSVILKIAEVFEVSPIWLMGLTDNKNYKIK